MNWKATWEDKGLEWTAYAAISLILLLAAWNWISGQGGTYNQPLTIQSPSEPFAFQPSDANDSKLEKLAKVVVEDIFKRPFHKIRPDFLRNDVTGQNLEIDLYNEQLALGIEVNGDQHYRFIPYFHRTRDDFLKQRYRDEMKKIKCQQRGITLIEIPYKVGEKGLKPYLINQLRKEGYLL